MKPINKRGKWIAILPILLLSTYLYLLPLAANADISTPPNVNLTRNYTLQTICSNTTTCKAQSLNDTQGDLLVVVLTCTPQDSPPNANLVVGVVDDQGNNYVKATGLRLDDGFIPNPSKPIASVFSQAFYALSAIANKTGAFTITMTENTPSCIFYAGDIGIRATNFQLPNSIGGELQTLSNFLPSFSFNEVTPTCLNPCVSNEYWFQYDFGAYSNNLNSTNVRSITVKHDYPMLNITQQQYYPTVGSFFSATEALLQSPSNFTSFSTTYSCSNPAGVVGCNYDTDRYWKIGSEMLAFSTTNGNNFCYQISQTKTHIKYPLGSTQILSNVTYVNWFTYNGTGSVTVTKIQVNVKSVTNAPTGGTKLTLALYEADYNNFFSQYNTAETGVGPIAQINSVLMIDELQTFTLTNSATPTNYTLFTQFAVPTGVVAFFVLTTTHNGVTVYNSTATGLPPIAIDRHDGFSGNIGFQGYKVLPININYLNFNQKNINLFGSVVIPCSNTIFEIPPPPLQTTITTSTTGLSPTNCSNGQFNFAILGKLLTMWPVWLVPLLMGGLFGIIGLFLGMLLGMGIGTLENLVPIWADLLITLTTFLLLIRREI